MALPQRAVIALTRGEPHSTVSCSGPVERDGGPPTINLRWLKLLRAR